MPSLIYIFCFDRSSNSCSVKLTFRIRRFVHDADWSTEHLSEYIKSSDFSPCFKIGEKEMTELDDVRYRSFPNEEACAVAAKNAQN